MASLLCPLEELGFRLVVRTTASLLCPLEELGFKLIVRTTASLLCPLEELRLRFVEQRIWVLQVQVSFRVVTFSPPPPLTPPPHPFARLRVVDSVFSLSYETAEVPYETCVHTLKRKP